MKIKNITYKPGKGVDVEAAEVEVLELADGNIREVETGNIIYGVGLKQLASDPQNPTEQELEAGRANISAKLAGLIGPDAADIVADAAVKKMERDQANARADAAEAARDAAVTAREQAEAAAEQLSQVLAEKENKISELKAARDTLEAENAQPKRPPVL